MSTQVTQYNVCVVNWYSDTSQCKLDFIVCHFQEAVLDVPPQITLVLEQVTETGLACDLPQIAPQAVAIGQPHTRNEGVQPPFTEADTEAYCLHHIRPGEVWQVLAKVADVPDDDTSRVDGPLIAVPRVVINHELVGVTGPQACG